jgi:hypothetical protein
MFINSCVIEHKQGKDNYYWNMEGEVINVHYSAEGWGI